MIICANFLLLLKRIYIKKVAADIRYLTIIIFSRSYLRLDIYDFVFARLLLDILQRVAHRRVVEVVGDALRSDWIHKSAKQQCDCQRSFHCLSSCELITHA